MKILHLETSSKNCSVAISDGEKLLCLCEEFSENYKQSENLHTFIEWALEGAKITLNDLDAVSLGKGPGSYTGLRIGAASAKGFCYALNIPLIAVNSLVSMAEPWFGKDFDLVVPMIDARRMEVYTTTFDGATGAELYPTRSLILDENSFEKFNDKKAIFIGDGAAKVQNIFKGKNFTFEPKVYPSAIYQIKSAVAMYNAKDFQDVAYFEPDYLKEFFGLKKT